MDHVLSGQRLAERLDQLAAVTDEPGMICRTFLSPAMRRANELVGGWMREVGCEVSVDGWGNLIGHLPATLPDAPTLLLGSHLDTVRNAGRYDGPLGVLVALEALDALRSLALPFHLDVLGFSDEEGTRFHSAYLGSKSLLGLIEKSDLALEDQAGISLEKAVADFQGVTHLELPVAKYQPNQLLGYVEVHIEQGPVLQQLGQPLGIVDFIAAQSRFVFTWKGRAGHAGTTPMNLRQDALAGAAEFILAVEALGQRTVGLVATVGQLQVGPNVSNVIPDQVRLSLDIRHPDLAILQRSCSELKASSNELAVRRGLAVSSTVIQETQPVACSQRMNELWNRIVGTGRERAPHLVSGAGHDGVILSRQTEISMLFVRCKDGISHHPAEEVSQADLSAACDALTRFIREFA